MKQVKTFYTFTRDDEKEIWLVQHVPHRICAALTWLNMPGVWAMPPRPNLPNMDFGVWCKDRCVEEGRKVAIRWLIEFVGITLKNGKAAALEPYRNGKSVTIIQVGGIEMFSPTHPDAYRLAKIWEACSQASMHPTMDTRHDSEGPDDLAWALQIVIAHLDSALYKPNGRDLWKIVHQQEALAIARAGIKGP